MTILANAKEESSYFINFSFYDENETLVIPVTATWTLTDVLGNVVNSRLHVPMALASSVDIVLKGSDLVTLDTGKERVITVEATYNSTLGDDLPLTDSETFEVEDLIHLPDDIY